MTIVRDQHNTKDAMAIVQKYEDFVKYVYPILQRSPRYHSVLRDTVIAELFAPVGELYHASKSQQVSRLYAIDARFATLRSHLRFLVLPDVRILTRQQHTAALRLLAEPGAMLGAWIRKLRPAAAGSGGTNKRSDAPAHPMGQAGK